MLKGAIELWVVFDIGEAQIIAGQALQDSAEIWQVWFPVQLQVGSTSGHCMQPAPIHSFSNIQISDIRPLTTCRRWEQKTGGLRGVGDVSHQCSLCRGGRNEREYEEQKTVNVIWTSH